MSGNKKIASRRLSASVAIAVVAALSVASPAFATDDQATATTAPASKHDVRCETQTGSHVCKPEDLEKIVVFGGADLRPGDTQWTDDDTSAPALPVTRDQDTVGR